MENRMNMDEMSRRSEKQETTSMRLGACNETVSLVGFTKKQFGSQAVGVECLLPEQTHPEMSITTSIGSKRSPASGCAQQATNVKMLSAVVSSGEKTGTNKKSSVAERTNTSFPLGCAGIEIHHNWRNDNSTEHRYVAVEIVGLKWRHIRELYGFTACVDWADQGWGYQKGEIHICVIRNRRISSSTSSSASSSPGERGTEAEPMRRTGNLFQIAPHTRAMDFATGVLPIHQRNGDDDDGFSSSTHDADYTIQITYRVGGGGGHSLRVHSFQLRLYTSFAILHTAANYLFSFKTIRDLRNSDRELVLSSSSNKQQQQQQQQQRQEAGLFAAMARLLPTEVLLHILGYFVAVPEDVLVAHFVGEYFDYSQFVKRSPLVCGAGLESSSSVKDNGAFRIAKYPCPRHFQLDLFWSGTPTRAELEAVVAMKKKQKLDVDDGDDEEEYNSGEDDEECW